MQSPAAQVDVAIVGAGLAGLACAHAVRELGLRVCVMERTAGVGGRAASIADAATGDAVDVGPHIFLTEYPNLRALLAELGTERDIVWQRRPFISLVEQGRTLDMNVFPLSPPLHLLPSLAKVPTLSARDKLSNRAMVWLAMQMNESRVLELDNVSALDLLRSKGVSHRFIEWFWASACLSLLNVPLERCSAGALLRMYAHLMTHRDYRIGFPARPLADMYGPPLRAEMEARNGQILLMTGVARLVFDADCCSGVELEDGTRVMARWVVLAIPPADLAKLQQRSSPGLRLAHCEAFEPSPYVSVYLWLDRKITQRKFWARLWSPDGLNSDFYDLSNIRNGWESRPSLIASNIIYSHRAHSLSDEDVVRRTTAELAECIAEANAARVLHSRVHRIDMAIPCPAPGTERLRPGVETSVPNVLLAGDWTRTELPACMESAVRSGFLAAERIHAALGIERSIAARVSPPQGLAGIVNRISTHRVRKRAPLIHVARAPRSASASSEPPD